MAKADNVELHGFVSTDARGKKPSKFLENSKAEAETAVKKEVNRKRICGPIKLITLELGAIPKPASDK